ncbi:MAG: putative aldo/keto reductase [Thermoleophilia bacterium]|nr:putative aldo/keto reductase [Thermoleophilia bacterium]
MPSPAPAPHPLVTIPTTDIRTPPIALGGNVFGWTADEAASIAILDAFAAGGGRIIDTADMYSQWVPGHEGGESERTIGRWLAGSGRRGDVVVATKVGKLDGRRGLAPDNVSAAADASLERLGIDAIDLFYAHEDDASQTMEEIVSSFDALVRAGKVRYWALSNVSPERTDEAVQVAEREGLARPVAVQPHFNLVHRAEYEDGLAQVVERHDLAVLPYFGLASGFLTGKYDRDSARRQAEGAARGGAVGQYFTEAGFGVVDALRDVADDLGTEPASVALAWLAAQPGAVIPIASASRPDQVEGLLAAAHLSLRDDHLARLDEASRGVTA